MSQIEITVTGADEAPAQPLKDRIRFRLEFMAMMLQASRYEEANEAFARALDLIERIPADIE